MFLGIPLMCGHLWLVLLSHNLMGTICKHSSITKARKKNKYTFQNKK